TEETIDLSSIEEGIKAWRADRRTAPAQLKSVFLFAVHVPGVEPRKTNAQTDDVVDIAQRMDVAQDRQLRSFDAVIIRRKRGVKILSHADHCACVSRCVPEKSIVFSCFFAAFLRNLRKGRFGESCSCRPEGHA